MSGRVHRVVQHASHGQNVAVPATDQEVTWIPHHALARARSALGKVPSNHSRPKLRVGAETEAIPVLCGVNDCGDDQRCVPLPCEFTEAFAGPDQDGRDVRVG